RDGCPQLCGRGLYLASPCFVLGTNSPEPIRSGSRRRCRAVFYRDRPSPCDRSAAYARSPGIRRVFLHSGGSPKRFCCPAHRMTFWSAARRWAERAVVAGSLSVDDIRNGVGEACTLRPGTSSPAPVPSPPKSGVVAPGEPQAGAVEQLDDS